MAVYNTEDSSQLNNGDLPESVHNRLERFLNYIRGGGGALPADVRNELERYLNHIGNGGQTLPGYLSNRISIYLAKIAGANVTLPATVNSRLERFLADLAGAGGGPKDAWTRLERWLVGPGLPPEYREVTGVGVNQTSLAYYDTGISIGFRFSGGFSIPIGFGDGNRIAVSLGGSRWFGINSNSLWAIGANVNLTEYSDEAVAEVTLSNDYRTIQATVNGRVLKRSGNPDGLYSHYRIFGATAIRQCPIAIHSLTLYDADDNQHDLVPAIRIADEAVGFYIKPDERFLHIDLGYAL